MSDPPSRTRAPAVVVDTDVVSFLFKRDTRAVLYAPYLAGVRPVITFMTVAELAFWAEKRSWGARRRSELRSFLLPYTVHYADRDLCETWAVVRATVERSGGNIGYADAWHAATALLYGVELVSNNPRHYAGVPGLVVLSEAPQRPS